jgi:multidrug transporter EmrE-like cation transporter
MTTGILYFIVLFNIKEHGNCRFIGLIAYAIVMYFLIQILKYANVMQMNISWDAVSVIVETALAYYLLHETLSGVTQYVGFIMIILGMVFMGIGKQAYK